MAHITSADGTAISLDWLSEHGPALVLVGGGLDDGSENVPLGEHLAGDFAVVNYRRRGRGDSGDTLPYSVEREVEDLAAVIEAAGGHACAFGASSGGALVLEAAAAGVAIDRVALHEVAYLVDEDLIAAWQSYTVELAVALDRGDRDEALRLFMRLAGSSEEGIAAAEAAPVWPFLVELAPTLRYDAACLGDGPPPAERLAKVIQPVLLTTGPTTDSSSGLPGDFFSAAAEAAAECLPNARRATVPLSGHVADPDLLGPMLKEFFSDKGPSRHRL